MGFTSTIVILLFVLCSIFGLFSLSKENIYKNFIPNFDTNYFNRNQDNKNDSLHKEFEGKRKFKNRINKNNNLDNQIRFNNISIYEISSIMILFAGGTYLILNTIEKKKNK